MKTERTILEFHVGRGGSFNNGGHLFFVGKVSGIDQTSAFSQTFEPLMSAENEEDERLRDDNPNAEYTDESGNSVGLTNAEVASGIGRIDFDGEYDTTYTTYADELSEDEAKLVFQEAYKFDGQYADISLLSEILHIDDVKLIELAVSLKELTLLNEYCNSSDAADVEEKFISWTLEQCEEADEDYHVTYKGSFYKKS